ncbi:MAG: NAD-dependent epimerase/dehydratase family protein [Hyphomonadaceae bacterium]|nr:NAD-dependent epimerase/dehydratase family protein [Hyphomonadaceae bacterium]
MSMHDTTAQDHHVVLGAGALGGATAEALLGAGLKVSLVSRSGAANAPAGAASIAATLGRDDLASQCRGAAAIYFCAQPPYHQWPQHFPALQDAAVTLAETVGAPLIVAENLYGYGTVDAPMTESTPLRPTTRKGGVRTAMHHALLRAQDEGRVRVAVARGSDFFGPRVQGSAVGARFVDAVRAGKPAEAMGDVDALHTYTYVKDFGAALALLGRRAEALGEVWHVPNAPAITTRRFIELAYRLSGHPPKHRIMRRAEMAMIGLFIPAVREMIEMGYAFDRDYVVDHSKFAAAFGDISTPLEAALAETLDDARQWSPA